MTINSENKLLSIDESCLSELSDENQSTISGGTFGLLSWSWSFLFSWCLPKPVYVAPQPVCPPPQPVCPPPQPVCEPPKSYC
ncbi:hypothetical protein NIES22_34250 [Calothrix brevissima NIES-22]|nr:hypothetical protein NIES22_34250 [Calothrix brevissima NIES-22]